MNLNHCYWKNPKGKHDQHKKFPWAISEILKSLSLAFVAWNVLIISQPTSFPPVPRATKPVGQTCRNRAPTKSRRRPPRMSTEANSWRRWVHVTPFLRVIIQNSRLVTHVEPLEEKQTTSESSTVHHVLWGYSTYWSTTVLENGLRIISVKGPSFTLQF